MDRLTNTTDYYTSSQTEEKTKWNQLNQIKIKTKTSFETYFLSQSGLIWFKVLIYGGSTILPSQVRGRSNFGCSLEVNLFLSYNVPGADYMRENGPLPDHIHNQTVPSFDSVKW